MKTWRYFLWTVLVLFLWSLSMFLLWSYEVYDHGTHDPVLLTRERIDSYVSSINNFAKTFEKVPDSLEELPRTNYLSYMSQDAWGYKLRYSVDADKHILTVFSLGRDGAAGGTGEDADIYASYYFKKPDGQFWAGSDQWFYEARVLEK
ncbi:MAG: type II secretion system protein GspG [Saprospiraceae bacterium]|nr:type II secretion system protein GspG [Saprospiraceae bacterium]